MSTTVGPSLVRDMDYYRFNWSCYIPGTTLATGRERFMSVSSIRFKQWDGEIENDKEVVAML